MQSQDETISFTWPSAVLAGATLIGMLIYWGTTVPIESENSVPYFIRLIALGAAKMPEPFYALPAVIIGIGYGISFPTVVDSLKASLIGIAAIALAISCAMLWNLGANLIGQINEDTFTAANFVTVLMLSSPNFFILIIRPLLLGSLCAAILLHLAASFLNEDHQDWMFDRSEIEGPPGPLLDMGAGFAVLLFTGWLFFGDALAMLSPPPTADEIVAELQPPLDGKTVLETPSGRESTRLAVRNIGFEVEATGKIPCNARKRSWLKTTINSYFRRITLIEDWKPGQQLSVFSREAVDLTRRSLSAGYVTWDEIEPYVRIHLDEKRDAEASLAARAKLSCA